MESEMRSVAEVKSQKCVTTSKVRAPFVYGEGKIQYYPAWLRGVCMTYFAIKCITPTCVHKWNDYYRRQEKEWADIFTRAVKVVRETTLQSFQFKLVHSIINCDKQNIRYENKSITLMFIRWWNKLHQPLLFSLPQCATYVVHILRKVEWNKISACKFSLLSKCVWYLVWC